MLSVGMCARFQAAPKESHYVAVKRIFRYLAHTPNFGLWYPRGANFKLEGFTDSDWAGDKVDRKSTSRGCQFLGCSLVSWSSKKQSCVSLSSTEAEYVAVGSCCAQLLWMRQTLKITGSFVTKCLFGVTMKVPSRFLSTRCNISRRSILRFGITSSGITLGKERSRSSMSTLMITLQIFSRSPWMKQDFAS